jgi:hypothetical protein
MPPETTPHLENPDVQPATAKAVDQLRASAAREESKPTRDRLKRAMSLLHQLRGVAAAAKLELPIDVEQEYSVLVHEDVLARKEQANG